ncbi:hypothetical protein J8273_0914 [Carpediemonas membranifera]|uniref:Reverse transcriptase domain-containing protein n=1 Tax=Carpediemonas membranifera TaxID=201153 RepID=A0A8J6E2C0_9EUKA|nr:hypothetical protein J8273_0914 [Carpediemonas membranifera]|eukprot:KAG9397419.1 hypothetical protein J8273_0914 [Carpediemonas membranifera]
MSFDAFCDSGCTSTLILPSEWQPIFREAGFKTARSALKFEGFNHQPLETEASSEPIFMETPAGPTRTAARARTHLPVHFASWVDEPTLGLDALAALGMIDHSTGNAAASTDIGDPSAEPRRRRQELPPEYQKLVEKNWRLFSDQTADGDKTLPAYPIELIDGDTTLRENARQLSPPMREVAAEEIRRMLHEKVIRRARGNDTYASPIVIVRQKGKYRFCIDYRKLNAATRSMSLPTENIEAMLAATHGFSHFATLDLRRGYNQVPIREEDISKTAFTTPMGLFEATRLPFGLKNAPAFFQDAMNTIFRELIDTGKLHIYIDDFLVKAHSDKERLETLKRLLQIAAEYDLRFNLDKCDLASEEVNCVGYLISKDGIRMDPARIAAVRDMAKPTDLASLRRFLGPWPYSSRGSCPTWPPYSRHSQHLRASRRWSSETGTTLTTPRSHGRRRRSQAHAFWPPQITHNPSSSGRMPAT